MLLLPYPESLYGNSSLEKEQLVCDNLCKVDDGKLTKIIFLRVGDIPLYDRSRQAIAIFVSIGRLSGEETMVVTF